MGVNVINWTPVSRKHAKHRCTLVAPLDTGQELGTCDIPQEQGVSLSAYGYAPCGAGGAIMRLFRLHYLFKYELPRSPDEWGDLLELCMLCQRFAKMPMLESEHGRPISESFRKAIEQNLKEPPVFKRF